MEARWIVSRGLTRAGRRELCSQPFGIQKDRDGRMERSRPEDIRREALSNATEWHNQNDIDADSY